MGGCSYALRHTLADFPWSRASSQRLVLAEDLLDKLQEKTFEALIRKLHLLEASPHADRELLSLSQRCRLICF